MYSPFDSCCRPSGKRNSLICCYRNINWPEVWSFEQAGRKGIDGVDVAWQGGEGQTLVHKQMA